MKNPYLIDAIRSEYESGRLLYIRCKAVKHYDLVFNKDDDGNAIMDICDKISSDIFSLEIARFYTAIYVSVDIFADLVYEYRGNYTQI